MPPGAPWPAGVCVRACTSEHQQQQNQGPPWGLGPRASGHGPWGRSQASVRAAPPLTQMRRQGPTQPQRARLGCLPGQARLGPSGRSAAGGASAGARQRQPSQQAGTPRPGAATPCGRPPDVRCRASGGCHASVVASPATTSRPASEADSAAQRSPRGVCGLCMAATQRARGFRCIHAPATPHAPSTCPVSCPDGRGTIG